MECPSCHHISDKAILQCSACNLAFDREQLENLQHLDFLLGWLAEQEEKLGARLYADLRRPIDANRQKLLAQLLPPEPEPEAPPIAEHDEAVIVQLDRDWDALFQELMYLHGVRQHLPVWFQAGALDFGAAYDLRQQLDAQIAALQGEISEQPALTVTPTSLEVIDYALVNIAIWRQAGFLRRDIALQLLTYLESEKELLTASLHHSEPAATLEESQPEPLLAPATDPEQLAVSVPVRSLSAQPASPAPARIRRRRRRQRPQINFKQVWNLVVEAAVSGALLRGLLYLGAFMIVIASGVLVIRFWNIFPPLLQFGFIAALPTSFYLAGWGVRRRLELLQAGTVLAGIGALLVAIDFAAVYQIGGLSELLSFDMYWLIASAICFVVYMLTVWRLPTEFFAYITWLVFTSILASLVNVVQLPLEWNLVAVAAAAVLMLVTIPRQTQLSERWQALPRATLRLAALLLPLSQVVVLFSGGFSWGQMITFGLAAVGYYLLALQKPGLMPVWASIISSALTVVLTLLVIEAPPSWFVPAAAAIGPLYLGLNQLSDSRFFPEPGNDIWSAALRATGYGLIGLASLAALILFAYEPWVSVLALAVAAATLSVFAAIYRRPVLLFLGSGEFVLTAALALGRLLFDSNVLQWGAWLMAALAGLALLYLALGLALARRPDYGQWLTFWTHIILPLGLGGLLANSVASSDWFVGPTLVALGAVITVYVAQALVHDTGRFPILIRAIEQQIPTGLKRNLFLWPLGLLTPVLLSLAWSAGSWPTGWLGTALVGVGLLYVAAGELLSRRAADYRLPPHLYAYLMAAVGIGVALATSWALLATLLMAVVLLAVLAVVYRRAAEAIAAAVLFIWPFQLALQLSPLPVHAYTLAYGLLATLAYMPLALWLNRPVAVEADDGIFEFNLYRFFYLLTAGLASYAAVTSFLGRFGFYPANYLTVGMVVPWLITALALFNLYRFKHNLFAWAVLGLGAVAFGQTLTWLRVPAPFDALAWATLAVVSLGGQQLLGRTSGQAWWQALRLPLATGAALQGVAALLLTAPDTYGLLLLAEPAAPLPLILAQLVVVVLILLFARLYQSHWPAYLEPWVLFFPVTLFFAGYGSALFGQPLTTSQYGLVWAALAFIHLCAGILLDKRTIRYAHGIFAGSYFLSTWAIFWTLTRLPALVWTMGAALLILLLSAYLVQRHRHHSWADFLGFIFRDDGVDSRNWIVRNLRLLFVWLAASIFPIWTVLLLARLNSGGGFYWLGFSGGGLLLLLIGYRLAQIDPDYDWSLNAPALVYNLLALLISAPLTLRFFIGGHDLPAENTVATGFIAVQAVTVIYFAVTAALRRQPLFTHAAAWLSFVPLTLGWIVYDRRLTTAQFAWVWLSLAVVLLAIGFALDKKSLRFAHGPYLAGYLIAGLALLWSIPETLANLYTLAGVVVVAAISHYVVHRGRHHSFNDFIGYIWRRADRPEARVARILFLIVAVYGLPAWLGQLFFFLETPLGWRGVSFALVAPIYVALGLLWRRLDQSYTWPLYSMGYALTAIGAMLAFADERLAIFTLSLNVVVYAVSAYIFRQSFWLYLATVLTPIVILLSLNYNGILNAAWLAGTFMGIALLYVAVGFWFNRRRAADINPYALPFFGPGYLLSAIALAGATSERTLAITVFGIGAGLYLLSARAFRESLFLYPSAFLATVPYYLLVTWRLPADTFGLAWLPLIVGYILLGRFSFTWRVPDRGGWAAIVAGLLRPATPFYLTAYILSVSMVVQVSEPLPATVALIAATVIYLGSALMFRQRLWLYPSLLTAHLALSAFLSITPSASPDHFLSVPFMAFTWVVGLLAYGLSRRAPLAARSANPPMVTAAGRTFNVIAQASIVRYLRSSTWAQPVIVYLIIDLFLWQAVAFGGLETAFTVGLGYTVLAALLATLWQDSLLPYGALIFLLIAVIGQAMILGYPFSTIMAGLAGLGFLLYLVASLIEWRLSRSFLAMWRQPLIGAGICLTIFAVVATLPFVLAATQATAISLAFAGALYLTMAYRGQYYRLGYAAMGMLQVAWALLLIDQDIAQPQLYAVPAGLYIAAIGILEKRRERQLFGTILESFGLLIILLTSFIQSLNGAAGFIYFVLLLAEALLAIWWGAARRSRYPFFIGIGAAVINVLAQLLVLINVYDVNRWIVILGTGLLLVTVGILVERRREQIVEQAQEWREMLKGWT